MKLICLIALLIWTGLSLPAQTNVPAAPDAPDVATTNDVKKTIILSDGGGVMNFLHNTVTYYGNVRVIDPQFKLTCEWLMAEGDGSRSNHIIALTNVVITTFDAKHGTNEALADHAEYIYFIKDGVTNDSLTLTGDPDPQLIGPKMSQTAKVIVIHPSTGDIELQQGHGITTVDRGANVNPFGTSPNAAAPKVADTNLPPATVTNATADGTNNVK
jgi:hypothetical protein